MMISKNASSQKNYTLIKKLKIYISSLLNILSFLKYKIQIEPLIIYILSGKLKKQMILNIFLKISRVVKDSCKQLMIGFMSICCAFVANK